MMKSGRFSEKIERSKEEFLAHLVKNLVHAPSDRAVHLLIRHSIREVLPPDGVGQTQPITAAGRELAIELGRQMRGRVETLHASPFVRCLQTAEALQIGAEAKALQVVPDRFLGDPGIFVFDEERAWKNWKQHGNLGVMLKMIEQEEPLPGMRPSLAASHQLVREMFRSSGGRPGLHLYVSHDTFVLTTASKLLGVVLPDEEWPGFLEALFLWEEEGQLVLRYLDRSARLAFDFDRNELVDLSR